MARARQKAGAFNLGSVSGLTHGDDFVLTGPTKRLTEIEKKMTAVYPIIAKIISYGSSEHQNVEQKVALGKGEEAFISTIPDTLTCL